MVMDKRTRARRKILVSETSSASASSEEDVNGQDKESMVTLRGEEEGSSGNTRRLPSRPTTTNRSANPITRNSPYLDELCLPVQSSSGIKNSFGNVASLVRPCSVTTLPPSAPNSPFKNGLIPLWNLWTIWDPSLVEFTRPSAVCQKRRKMSRDEFGKLILSKFKTLSSSFQFPNDMTFVTIEVTGEPSRAAHGGFTNIPIRFCDFQDLKTTGDWTLRALLNLGVLLSLTFKIGEIVIILGGMIDYEIKTIYLNKSPVKAHIVHLADDINSAPTSSEVPFSVAWSQFAVQSKLQLFYFAAQEFTILKTFPYIHHERDRFTPVVESLAAELPNSNRAVSVHRSGHVSNTVSTPPKNLRLIEVNNYDDVNIIPETPPTMTTKSKRRSRKARNRPQHTAKQPRLEGGFIPDEEDEDEEVGEIVVPDSVAQNEDSRPSDADNIGVVPPPQTTVQGPSTSTIKSSTDHNWRNYWRPEVIHKRNTYDYQTLRTYKDRLQQGPPADMAKGQLNVYGVVAQVLQSDKQTDYKIRISDETLKGVFVRIHTSSLVTELGPPIACKEIIRIHRCSIQNEVTERGNEMVISTGPHQNYVLFNMNKNVQAPVLQATSANKITFSDTDEKRVRQLREFLNAHRHTRNLLEPEEELVMNGIGDEHRNSNPNEHQASPTNRPNQNSQNQSQSQPQTTESQDGILYSEFCGSTDSESFSSQIAPSETFNMLGSPLVTMASLTREQQLFTMKCVILGSVYTAAMGELCIRVSDGTVSEHLNFVNYGRLPDTLKVNGMPHVDIIIKQIHENPVLWSQISDAESGNHLWLLSKIKIAAREDQSSSGLLELIVDAKQSSLDRFVEYSQTITDADSGEMLLDELDDTVHDESTEFGSSLRPEGPTHTSTPLVTKQNQHSVSLTAGYSSRATPRTREPLPPHWPYQTPTRPVLWPTATAGSESDTSAASELEITVIDATKPREELFPKKSTSPAQTSLPDPQAQDDISLSIPPTSPTDVFLDVPLDPDPDLQIASQSSSPGSNASSVYHSCVSNNDED